MLKRIISRTLAAMLAGAFVFSSIPDGGISFTDAKAAQETGVPAILRQLRKDNNDSSLRAEDVFLTDKPVKIRQNKDIMIGKIDPRFREKNLKKVKGKVRLYPVSVYDSEPDDWDGDLTKSYFFHINGYGAAKHYRKMYGENCITASDPINTAVRVVYTYHKVKKPKKSGKKSAKVVYSKKTYREVRLLEVVSCPDDDPEYLYPEYFSGLSKAAYSQVSYVKLLQYLGRDIPESNDVDPEDIDEDEDAGDNDDEEIPGNSTRRTKYSSADDDDIPDADGYDRQDDPEDVFRLDFDIALYDRLGSYDLITDADRSKGLRLWKEQGCPTDSTSRQYIVETVASDIEARRAAAEKKTIKTTDGSGQKKGGSRPSSKNTDTQNAAQAKYNSWRSGMLSTLGLTDADDIKYFDIYADRYGHDIIQSQSADSIRSGINTMFLPGLNYKLNEKLNAEVSAADGMDRSDAYIAKYKSVLQSYTRGDRQITDFTTTVDDKFAELKADAAAKAEEADAESQKIQQREAEESEQYRKDHANAEYYGVNQEVLDAYRETAGEGSDFRRYSRIFHRTQKEVCYGSADCSDLSEYHNPNHYVKNADGSFHFTLVCSGWAELVAGICRYCGIPAHTTGNANHAWVVVTLGGEAFNSDPTMYHHNYYQGLFRKSANEDKSDMPAGAWLIYNGEENCHNFEKFGY